MISRSLAALAIAALPFTPRWTAAQATDTGFTALQKRGEMVMGVNQYTSTHRFDDLPDGGRIELQRNLPDSAGVDAIRRHLVHIAQAFAAGDFSSPGMVHSQEVPGARIMAARHDLIKYEFRPLPRGGEVRISTSDAESRDAIHAFLAFQRREHRAGRKEPSD
jgi:hypothetical protein